MNQWYVANTHKYLNEGKIVVWGVRSCAIDKALYWSWRTATHNTPVKASGVSTMKLNNNQRYQMTSLKLCTCFLFDEMSSKAAVKQAHLAK